MEKENAIKILIEAAKIAQAKGVFDLPSAKVVAVAVEVLSVEENPPQGTGQAPVIDQEVPTPEEKPKKKK